jgi:hypothetical protein
MKIVLASAEMQQAASGQRFGPDIARDADRWTEGAISVLECVEKIHSEHVIVLLETTGWEE